MHNDPMQVIQSAYESFVKSNNQLRYTV